MRLFWQKKKETTATIETTSHGVNDADQEWQRLERERQKEQKRAEKERKKAAKRAMKEMKKHAKAARKERKRLERETKRQARTVQRIQKADEKRRNRLVRKRKKEEKRRRKQQAKEEKALRRRAQQQQQQQPEVEVSPAQQRPGAVPSAALPLAPPTFKERENCSSCHTRFGRLPGRRRHHCRNCGDSFCHKCLSNVKRAIPWFKLDKPQKVCYTCDVTVFNGMGGASRPGSGQVPPVTSNPSPVAAPVAPPQPPSPQLVSPQSDLPRPPSSGRLRISLRPRSRRENGSSKSKKGSLWTFPLRPLLKRKESAEQLRKRAWDLDLHLEKAELLARQRTARMLVLDEQPQFARAS
ncbi:hypothetical protein Poli38472_010722 [Pythium oligandrum]|uniref:FYVE-type domain-containing protein n=1 Tax=Pythium oligandrum TaxID=41045 RepID=A0A8K1CDY2_PYTOL|nr:hypothetical protein Poli38472_010722 [Pythium oligandrum]|eukprot:TMW61659.1 hypothetical protein Poli38472_010722 [Pythium oligandrum]